MDTVIQLSGRLACKCQAWHGPQAPMTLFASLTALGIGRRQCPGRRGAGGAGFPSAAAERPRAACNTAAQAAQAAPSPSSVAAPPPPQGVSPRSTTHDPPAAIG